MKKLLLLCVALALIVPAAHAAKPQARDDKPVVLEDGAPFAKADPKADPGIVALLTVPVFPFTALRGGVIPMRQNCNRYEDCWDMSDPMDCFNADYDCMSICDVVCQIEMPGTICGQCGLAEVQGTARCIISCGI